MELKIGTARECITPEIGGLLMGYGSSVPSDSVHDGLNATAIALEYGQEKVILLSLDLCLIENDLTAELREACGRAANIPAANVLLATTHTHSGPNFDGSGDGGYVDNILMPRLISAAGNCVKNMRSATVGIAKANTLTGINRRELLADNSVILGQNPWGPYDPEMTIISFKDENDMTVANWVHYGAHSTSAGMGTIITRDWSGVMTDRLEAETGGAPAAFLNGAMGDVAPRMANGRSSGDITHVAEVGGLAGMDAVRAYGNIAEYRREDMAVRVGEVRIPYEIYPPGGVDAYSYELTVIRIGPVVMVPTPFEVFSQLSLRMRAYSPFGHTLLLGLANGFNMYLPSRDQIIRGGYEVERFVEWSAPSRLPDDTDRILIEQSVKIISSLY